MENPIDRALLAAFVEMVHDHSGGPVADLGCGPGRVAAFLASGGIEVVGIDVSREMLIVASTAHSGLPLAQATLAALPFRDGSLRAAVSWYSIIHTPPELLDRVWAELGRVIAKTGHLLIAFQAGGGEALHRDEIFGRPASLTSYRHAPTHVEQTLVEAGFRVHARVARAPVLAHETTPQAFVIASLDGPK
jgi:SAM-dependent methyltransferase